jgi:hypothetical protein
MTKQFAEVVLPHLSGVLLERMESGPEATYLFGRARGETAACPGYGTVSTSVRGRYQRSLADTPIGGRPVWLILQVRRFNCWAGLEAFPRVRAKGAETPLGRPGRGWASVEFPHHPPPLRVCVRVAETR